MRQKHHFSAEYKELVGKKNLHNLNPFSSFLPSLPLAHVLIPSLWFPFSSDVHGHEPVLPWVNDLGVPPSLTV